jgi:DNA topoisomerase-3
MVRTLLSKLETRPMRVQTKSGDRFTASLQLVKANEDNKWELKFIKLGTEEPMASAGITTSSTSKPDGSASQVIGQCPSCGGDVVEGKKGFGCSNWKGEDGACRFVVWKVIAGKEIPRGAVQEILEGQATETIEGFISKKGKPFSARLIWDEEDQRVTFVF